VKRRGVLTKDAANKMEGADGNSVSRSVFVFSKIVSGYSHAGIFLKKTSDQEYRIPRIPDSRSLNPEIQNTGAPS
jgi:hypothetical protein